MTQGRGEMAGGRKTSRKLFLLLSFFLVLSILAPGKTFRRDKDVFHIVQTSQTLPDREKSSAEILPEYKKFIPLTVPGNMSWTDSGLDVEEGEELFFRASGTICLQKGNPRAYCGPEGYDIRTVQQPLAGENLGALIGRVVLLISLNIEEETGKEIRHELIETFSIGVEKEVAMPIRGRLLLGVNENVIGDNEGEFTVLIYREKRMEEDS